MNNEQELTQQLQKENKQLKLLLGEYVLNVKILSDELDTARQLHYGLYKEYVALKEEYDNLNSPTEDAPVKEEKKDA